MATNDITLYIPPTEEEVMLIQPNNVTFGQYSVTEWQENLLTLISDQIQQHMTREKQLPKDLFNQPVVEIKCDEAGGKNNKSKVLKEAIAMMRKNFSFFTVGRAWENAVIKAFCLVRALLNGYGQLVNSSLIHANRLDFG